MADVKALNPLWFTGGDGLLKRGGRPGCASLSLAHELPKPELSAPSMLIDAIIRSEDGKMGAVPPLEYWAGRVVRAEHCGDFNAYINPVNNKIFGLSDGNYSVLQNGENIIANEKLPDGSVFTVITDKNGKITSLSEYKNPISTMLIEDGGETKAFTIDYTNIAEKLKSLKLD